jgi:hypothetical protein
MIGSIGFHWESQAQNVDKRNILGFNVDTSNMKYPFFTPQLLDDSCHRTPSKLPIAQNTRGTRKTGCRNQSMPEPLVSDFDRQTSADTALLYGLLKRSIIGGP